MTTFWNFFAQRDALEMHASTPLEDGWEIFEHEQHDNESIATLEQVIVNNNSSNLSQDFGHYRSTSNNVHPILAKLKENEMKIAKLNQHVLKREQNKKVGKVGRPHYSKPQK
jgi:hypothetical protein